MFVENPVERVSLGNDKGRLRLRWHYLDKPYCLYLKLDDTKANRLKARQTQLAIESDMVNGVFDTTLAKYKPHKTTGKPLSNLTVLELLEDWLKYKATYCDERTLEYYQALKTRLGEYFGDRQGSSIGARDAQAFYVWLKDTNISPETFHRRLEAIEACWKWLIQNNYLTDNPWQRLSKLAKAPTHPRPRPLTTDEIAAILDGFNEHPLNAQLTPFVRFLFGTGCRTGEAIGLRWQQLSEDYRLCTFAEQLTRGKRKHTKTGKVRTITLSPSLQSMLHQLAVKERVSQPAARELVFTWNGYPIELRNFRGRVWKHILKVKNVPYRPPYHTRHTFVSHCKELGMNDVVIAQITGHNIVTMYQSYAGSLYQTPQVPSLDKV